jgi:ABC-type antimicrobial peptide transport system permease subunit
MAGNGVRKPTLPRVSMGLGNILAQSKVVANAFGKWPGFVLMVLALMVALAVSAITAGVLVRGMVHVLGW